MAVNYSGKSSIAFVPGVELHNLDKSEAKAGLLWPSILFLSSSNFSGSLSFPLCLSLSPTSTLSQLIFCRESLLKGRAQYRRPPCTYKFKSVAFKKKILFTFVTKISYPHREVNGTESSLKLVFPVFAILSPPSLTQWNVTLSDFWLIIFLLLVFFSFFIEKSISPHNLKRSLNEFRVKPSLALLA